MKKYLLMALLPTLFIVSGFLFTNNASAYYQDNCYAIQYQKDTPVKDTFTKREVYSTNQLCYNNNSLEVKERPNASRTLSIGSGVRSVPSFHVSGDSVTLKYCKNGHMTCPFGKQEKVFKLSSYNGSFEEMAKDIDGFISGVGAPMGCTKLALTKNDATSGSLDKDGNVAGSEENEDGNSEGAGDPCYNANSNSQGWILCPTMRNMEYTATWMDSMIDEWLSVDTSLYDASSPTAAVWEIMRNIANVIMVIILLVIIFSQLTGVGIDNYGIKKMLPRLIAMAILINLSLVVCELAIDVSNILGTGLRNLFGAIGQSLVEGKGVDEYTGGNFVSTMVTSLLAMVAGLGAVAPMGLTVASIGFSASTMIIVVIVLALLVVLAALAVFFVMLGARMVIIIGCVAVAPVAFAFYILPNTQDLYKKWFAAFKTALVVFPICGAVSGIGQVIRGIVLSADEIQVWMGVIGIVAPFLAFFMLPSMLKGVLGTLGKVGEALTTMGQGVKSGAKGIRSAAQESDMYKEGMKYARDTSSLNRANSIQSKLRARAGGDINKLSKRQQSRYARAVTTSDAIGQQRRKEQALVAERLYADEGIEQLLTRFNRAFDDGNTDEVGAVASVLNKKYGAGAAAKLGESLSEKHGVSGNANYQASLNALKQTMGENTDFANNMRNKAADAYQMISDGGMSYNKDTEQMEYHDLDHFSANNSITTNAKDWSTQSSKTLERAIKAGKLKPEMINTLLTSTDPAIMSGIQSDEGKMAVLMAASRSTPVNIGGAGGADSVTE